MRSLAYGDGLSAEVGVAGWRGKRDGKTAFENALKTFQKTLAKQDEVFIIRVLASGITWSEYQSPGGFELFKKMRSSNSCGYLLMDIATLNIQR